MQLAKVQRIEVVPFEKVYQYVVRSTCYVRIPWSLNSVANRDICFPGDFNLSQSMPGTTGIFIEAVGQNIDRAIGKFLLHPNGPIYMPIRYASSVDSTVPIQTLQPS